MHQTCMQYSTTVILQRTNHVTFTSAALMTRYYFDDLSWSGAAPANIQWISKTKKRAVKLSILMHPLHQTRPDDMRGCRRRVTCPMADSLRYRLGIRVTGYRHGSVRGWRRGAMIQDLTSRGAEPSTQLIDGSLEAEESRFSECSRKVKRGIVRE
ncbi:hypothetical protein EVAR_48474_1 [Eumeta japonica]|uniref:Uncharacterized protein n=1 Tax=Eumeta variegata TaxID=151549 RepID=A0A4C1XEF3_EUMVA|nr:hypothetical protein EVAR_48474_1 [Eumeta japonica]